jgi:hypothetical protein
VEHIPPEHKPIEITREEWDRKHPDYKRIRPDGTRYWVELDLRSKASVLVNVVIKESPETCWICVKEKGQPPTRCPGHYREHPQTPPEGGQPKKENT